MTPAVRGEAAEAFGDTLSTVSPELRQYVQSTYLSRGARLTMGGTAVLIATLNLYLAHALEVVRPVPFVQLWLPLSALLLLSSAEAGRRRLQSRPRVARRVQRFANIEDLARNGHGAVVAARLAELRQLNESDLLVARALHAWMEPAMIRYIAGLSVIQMGPFARLSGASAWHCYPYLVLGLVVAWLYFPTVDQLERVAESLKDA